MRVVRERPWPAAAVAALVVLTVLAAFPFDPEGPLDARTWERLEGVRLEFPASGAIIEPFAAPGHAVAGAPDFAVAGVSSLLWIIAASAAVAGGVEFRRRSRRGGVVFNRDTQDGRDSRRSPSCVSCASLLNPVAVALRIAAWSVTAALVFLLYFCFVALVWLPGWRLVADGADGSDGADLIVADLQTHTFGSHDGVVSARDGLRLLRARGCDVVAVTEHTDPAGSFEAARLARADEGLPWVIPGVELRDVKGFLLCIGLHMDRAPPPQERTDEGVVRLVEKAHEDGGAVVALAWKLSPADVERLVAAGVDGFEIANAGHPNVPPDVRAGILEAHRDGGLVLVSSSDHHGWGGFWRTWTVVRVPRAGRTPGAAMSREAKAAALLAALRERRVVDVTPVVAGYLGRPSSARAVFAPFVEAARYAMELSPVRVLAWWVWVLALAGAAGPVRRAGFRPGRMMLACLLAVLGTGLVLGGARLLTAYASGATASAFPARIGGWGVGLGVASAGAAVALAVLELRRRSRRGVTGKIH